MDARKAFIRCRVRRSYREMISSPVYPTFQFFYRAHIEVSRKSMFRDSRSFVPIALAE
jgi:hypothetical protein